MSRERNMTLSLVGNCTESLFSDKNWSLSRILKDKVQTLLGTKVPFCDFCLFVHRHGIFTQTRCKLSTLIYCLDCWPRAPTALLLSSIVLKCYSTDPLQQQRPYFTIIPFMSSCLLNWLISFYWPPAAAAEAVQDCGAAAADAAAQEPGDGNMSALH